MNLTEAEQERVNEFRWCRVPTYEGGRNNKRVATSEGGKKHESLDLEDELSDNFYDYLEEIEEAEEDKEMEQDPGPMPGNCDICQSILREKRNRRRLERNLKK